MDKFKLHVDGKVLRELRKDTGLTQAQFGARIGLSRETVSSIENNHPGAINSITVQTLTRWRQECENKASRDLLKRFSDHLRKVLNL